MAIVYVIKNEINGKMYVGVTTKTIEERWKQHLYDGKREKMLKRKFYSDLSIYGEGAFSISELEDVEDDKRFQKEQYWVDRLDTFKNGYNETYGGDGRKTTGKEEDSVIASDYNKGMTITEIAIKSGKDCHTIRNSLTRSNVDVKSSQELSAIRNGKKVDMLDMEGNYITTFQSIESASNYLISNGMVCGDNARFVWGHIKDVCEGRNYRKSVAKHKWRYAE